MKTIRKKERKKEINLDVTEGSDGEIAIITNVNRTERKKKERMNEKKI